MRTFSVLLATDRPAVQTFFMHLGRKATPPISITPLPVRLEERELVPDVAHVATATMVVVDTTPDPVVVLQLCQALRAQRPTLPIIALLCCPHAVTSWQLRTLFGMGVRSLLDLHATEEEILRVLHSIARGDVVLHVQLTGGHSTAFEDVTIGHELGEATRVGRRWNTTLVRLLELLAHGLTDQQIGMQLHLSPHTVKHHIERVRDEVGARNRIELAAWAGEQGFYRQAPVEAPDMCAATAALG
jgi:DNA-binding NarL/FixJ family response regulator